MSALEIFNEQRASLAMILMQILYAGMALLSKTALNKGMSHLVFVFYRQAIATLALAPFAFALERKNPSRLSFVTFCKIFFLSLFGLTMSMDLYYMALRHTSATFASTATNMIPGFTFLIAIIFRIEMVDIRSRNGQFKIIGVVLCLGGAMTLSFYRGPPLKLLPWNNQASLATASANASNAFGEEGQVKGPLFMLASIITFSVWIVMQGRLLKDYTAKFCFTTLQCFLSSIQSSAVALIFDRNPSSWRLGWDIKLLSVIYCGAAVSGVSFWLQTWCIEQKGPVFVTMFYPLCPLITGIVSAMIWAELLYLGSVLGGIFIVGGLYCVAWGKMREVKVKQVQEEIDQSLQP